MNFLRILQTYVMKDCNTQHQKMRGVRCCMKMLNMKIIEMIWKIGSQLLKVRFVRYWIYWRIEL